MPGRRPARIRRAVSAGPHPIGDRGRDTPCSPRSGSPAFGKRPGAESFRSRLELAHAGTCERDLLETSDYQHLEGGRWQPVDTLSESVCGESTALVEPLIDLVGG